MSIIAVIPAYNEEVHIHEVIKKARHFVDEILVVDDCSTDATAHIAQSLGVRVVRHEEHAGRTAALISGFKIAREMKPSIIVTLYANGFHDPEDIPGLTEPILWLSADVVSGCEHIKKVNRSGPIEKGIVPNKDTVELVSAPFVAGESIKAKDATVAISEESDPWGDGHGFMNMGFSAFSSNVFDALTFDDKNGPVELSMIRDARDAGFKVKYVHVSRLCKTDTSIFRKYRIGVVVPAYNEEKLIGITISGIPEYVNRIYVINDCSKDNTAGVLASIKDPRLFVITHEVNQGVGAAILHGYQRALQENMDIIAVMGGDNQMNPMQLPSLLMPIIEGRADYTKGNRLLSEEFRVGMSKWRSTGNSLLTMITKIASGYWHIMDPQNGYTAISRRALSNMDLHNLYTYYGYCNDMLVKLNAFGFRALDVTMPARYGQERSSIKYSNYMGKVSIMLFKKFLWRLKMKYMVLSFHPLVLFYIFGMIMVPFGVLFGLYILLGKMAFGWSISANYPLLDAVILIMGIQFTLFAMLFDMQENNRVMSTPVTNAYDPKTGGW